MGETSRSTPLAFTVEHACSAVAKREQGEARVGGRGGGEQKKGRRSGSRLWLPCQRAEGAIRVSSYCCVCVCILLYTCPVNCPHTAAYVSSHCCGCVRTLLYVCGYYYVCVMSALCVRHVLQKTKKRTQYVCMLHYTGGVVVFTIVNIVM